MATIFSENENRDIFVDTNNKISISIDLQALIQAAKSSIEIQLGEAIYATGRGIPTDDVAWSGIANLQQFEFFARRQLLGVDGVTEITEFDASVDNNVLSYRATIKTIFGDGSLDGSL